MDQATKKKREGYILIPYKLIRACQSVFEALISGTIWSFAAEGRVCNYGYHTFQAKLNVSKSTVARKVKRISAREEFTVTRKGGRASEYTTTFELDDGAYIDFPLWLAKPFEVNGRTVELTPAEQLILALIYTYTKQKGGYGKLEGSPATIAAKLNDVVCSRTVKAALLKLEDLGLIFRKKRAVNAHGKGLGSYVANMSLFREILRAKKKAAKRKAKEAAKVEKTASDAPKPFVSKQVQDANARSDRERFYGLRKDDNQRLADQYEAKAFSKSPRLKEIDVGLRKIELEGAKAEIYNPATLPAVLAKKKRLKEERLSLIRSFGFDERLFDPAAYAKCELCNDTGNLPNGVACDCWRRQT